MKRAEREVVDRLVREAVAAHQGEPPILRADWFPFEDHQGEPALRVALVLPVQPDEASFDWLRDLRAGLASALRREELDLFPYISVVSEDEAPASLVVSRWLHGEEVPAA